jgi:hypothetical protein
VVKDALPLLLVEAILVAGTLARWPLARAH